MVATPEKLHPFSTLKGKKIMMITSHQLAGCDLLVRNIIPNNRCVERAGEPSNGRVAVLKPYDKNPVMLETGNFEQLGNYAWGLMNVRVLIPVSASINTYFIRVDAVQESGKRCFTVRLVKRENRNSCAFNDYKNILGGYFYLPEYQLPAYVKKYLAGHELESLLSFVRRYNKLESDAYKPILHTQSGE